MNTYLQKFNDDSLKTIDFFKKDISSLRTGRANPAILDNVQVDAYGTKSPINALANISISEARSILISPWDKSVSKDIEKAIVSADLGLSVVNEGDKIRISIPQLTEENRRDLVKKLNAKMEESRISLRKIRDEVKNDIEKAFTEKEIGEDDKFRFIKDLDEEMSQANNNLKNIRDDKEKDIMTI
jgi:ribosome recycling factor